jgi:nucleotide-binding universal stress UspA family protein
VDDSEGSRAALGVGQGLAERLGLELVLLHVAPPTEAPGVSAAAAGQQRLHEEERRDADEFLDRLARDAGLAPGVRRRVEIGAAADCIVSACRDENADLVVLGSRGRRGLKSALLGSVSAAVAARAPCPCVVVSPDAGGRLSLG